MFRGDEHDVLSRFKKIFYLYNPSTITRICGDCPLVEPAFIDRSIEEIIRQNVDYLKPNSSKIIHQGVETISNSCFRRNLAFKDDPIAKEHVTALIYENPNLYRVGKINVSDYEKNSGIRLSVDTKSDLNFIRQLYKKSRKKPGQLSIEEALDIISRNPTLLDHNSHVIQKKASQKEDHIYFYHKEFINEYFLKLARYFSEKKGFGVKFLATPLNFTKYKKLKSYGFEAKFFETDEEVLRLVYQETPKILYLPSVPTLTKLSMIYSLDFEKSENYYKLVRC